MEKLLMNIKNQNTIIINNPKLKKMKIKNLNLKNFALAILAFIFASCSSWENATDNTPTATQ